MIDMVKRSIQWALIVPLVIVSLPGVVSTQEREGSTEDIQNVWLVFHLIQADGFTDEDPEIRDVVNELRNLFNFQGYRLLSTSMLNVGLEPPFIGSARLLGNGSQRIVWGDSETTVALSADISGRRSSETVRATVTLIDVTRQVRQMRAPPEVVPLLEASVTIRDGQRVVLGSARRSAEEPVLILVVTPRFDPN